MPLRGVRMERLKQKLGSAYVPSCEHTWVRMLRSSLGMSTHIRRWKAGSVVIYCTSTAQSCWPEDSCLNLCSTVTCTEQFHPKNKKNSFTHAVLQEWPVWVQQHTHTEHVLYELLIHIGHYWWFILFLLYGPEARGSRVCAQTHTCQPKLWQCYLQSW